LLGAPTRRNYTFIRRKLHKETNPNGGKKEPLSRKWRDLLSISQSYRKLGEKRTKKIGPSRWGNWGKRGLCRGRMENELHNTYTKGDRLKVHPQKE